MTRRQRIALWVTLAIAGMLVLGAAAAGYRRADLMLLYENIILLCT
ncbi:MAG: hypothetical protein LJE97_08940 [Betaproteobacteria bacterium]|nr:hypothetical protein [Betaproteobacteria bacterium]